MKRLLHTSIVLLLTALAASSADADTSDSNLQKVVALQQAEIASLREKVDQLESARADDIRKLRSEFLQALNEASASNAAAQVKNHEKFSLVDSSLSKHESRLKKMETGDFGGVDIFTNKVETKEWVKAGRGLFDPANKDCPLGRLYLDRDYGRVACSR